MVTSAAAVPARTFAAGAATTYQRPAAPSVIISELQTGSSTSGNEEFVELYNNTDTDIDLADTAHGRKDPWTLQYFSSSKLAGILGTANWTSNPYRTIALSGVIAAHDYYILAATGYAPANLAPDQIYASTLSDEAGAVQLVDTATTASNTAVTVHDQLAWSADKTLPASNVLYMPPGAGSSLQRQPNDDSEYVNDDGTLTGFVTSMAISPDNAWVAPAAPTPPSDPKSGDGDDNGTDPAAPPDATQQTGSAPVITELLPNPASPQTDEADEYIELYNPGEADLNLHGYTLETGKSTLHDFTFTSDVILQPGSYLALYSADTGLSLSNSGGQARLIDREGTVVSSSDVYDAAADGQAWSLGDDGLWRWTMTPTPGAANIISLPLAKASVIKTAAKKKVAAAKVKGTTKIKKAKAAKAPKKAKIKKAAATLAADNSIEPTAPIHPVVLAAVAGLAVGYGVYEYRHDLANKVYQYRSHRAARRKARS